MVEKVMICEDCGKMFRVDYKAAEFKCPSCSGSNVVSIYRYHNIKVK